MPLNIENERVSRLAQELAEVTGESITSAVGEAIETRLAELRRQRDPKKVTAELMAIAEKCVNEASPEWLQRNFDDELYDERGLPK